MRRLRPVGVVAGGCGRRRSREFRVSIDGCGWRGHRRPSDVVTGGGGVGVVDEAEDGVGSRKGGGGGQG
jgi:hypothetical protein